MKIFGIVLLVIGILGIIGGITNPSGNDSTVEVLSYIIKFGLVIGGILLINKANESKNR